MSTKSWEKRTRRKKLTRPNKGVNKYKNKTINLTKSTTWVTEKELGRFHYKKDIPDVTNEVSHSMYWTMCNLECLNF